MGNCRFNPVWAKEFPWLKSVAGDNSRGRCNICDRVISVKRGAADIRKHAQYPGHVKKAELQNQEPAGAPIPVQKQSSIMDAMKKSQELQTKQRMAKDSALKFEYSLSVAVANHNIPGNFVDCVVNLLQKTITDSPTVREIAMHSTKCHYNLVEAIAPDMKRKVIDCMTRWPFSLNYDKSTVNKKSQLDINVSFRK